MNDIRIILASSSPRRTELLTMIGIPHEVMPADIDESYTVGEPAIAHAERLAREKGQVIAAEHPEALVVSADTIEEKVMALRDRKAKLFTSVLDDDGIFASALTADDIRGLLES